MTFISIVCRKNGSIVISRISDNDDYETVDFYTFSFKQNKVTRFISELQKLIDPYDTDILLVDFDRANKLQYVNQIYGCIQTLKIFGTINSLTFINDHRKMFTRISRYVNAGKKRKMTRNGIANLLLESRSCVFYTKSIEIFISNKSTQGYNQHRMSLISLYYMVVKHRLKRV